MDVVPGACFKSGLKGYSIGIQCDSEEGFTFFTMASRDGLNVTRGVKFACDTGIRKECRDESYEAFHYSLL